MKASTYCTISKGGLESFAVVREGGELRTHITIADASPHFKKQQGLRCTLQEDLPFASGECHLPITIFPSRLCLVTFP